MALHLAGLAPIWDENAARVSGVEVIPLALLGRPRIDVTLRVSGLFRDIFPGLAQLFETGAAALSAREEQAEDNPYLAVSPRVFAPEPGRYGLGILGRRPRGRRRGLADRFKLVYWPRRRKQARSRSS
jgi:cobaltochelatase CobN